MTSDFTLRVAGIADVPALHALIADNLEVGHLLPRTVEDLEQHADRFIVVETGGVVIAGAELAPLGHDVAEVRSGLTTGDSPSFIRLFWEVPALGTAWARLQSAPDASGVFSWN